MDVMFVVSFCPSHCGLDADESPRTTRLVLLDPINSTFCQNDEHAMTGPEFFMTIFDERILESDVECTGRMVALSCSRLQRNRCDKR